MGELQITVKWMDKASGQVYEKPLTLSELDKLVGFQEQGKCLILDPPYWGKG